MNPGKVSWVAERLRTNPDYRERIRIRKRCVRLNYAGDFHLDVVPAHCRRGIDDPLEVPDRAAAEWNPTHPKGFTAWCEQQNLRTAGSFTRVVKMMKWWRDTKLGAAIRPKSILLETLVGHSIPGAPSSDAEALTGTLQSMAARLNGALALFSAPTIPNPSLPEEDLSRDWEVDSFRLFRRRLTGASNIAQQALESANKSKTIRLWRQLLGATFPVSA